MPVRIRRLAVVGVPLLLVGIAVAYTVWPGSNRAMSVAQDAASRRDFLTALAAIQPDFDNSRANSDTLLFGARTARRAGQTNLADRYLRRYQEQGGDAEIIAIERILGGIQRGEVNGFDGGLQFCAKNPVHPEVPFVLEAMTEGYLKTGHLVKAIDTATRWLATTPTPADAAQGHIWRGTCYRNYGNQEMALMDFQAALKLTPDSPDAQTLVGEMLVGPEPEQASDYFTTALATQPNRVDARLGLARCHRNRGQSALAKVELDRILATQPDHLATLIERAKLSLDLREYALAEQDLRNVLTRAPRSLEANTTLARVLELTGREPESAKIRADVKAFETELFRKIQELVTSGMIPAPAPGNEFPKRNDP